MVPAHRGKNRTRRSQRGFFIIWGSKNFISREPLPPVRTTCPSCRQPAEIVGKTHRTWFVLYFVIPVFPVSGKTRFSECTRCRAQFRASIEEFSRLSQDQSKRGYEAAIAMFNDLRESPADGEKLLALMHLYLELGDVNEAISAGQTYRQAMESHDGCLALMGECYRQRGEIDNAQRHFAAAIALNPNNAAAKIGMGQVAAVA